HKSKLETNLEQAMAVGTLLTMMFDPNRSDAVYKVLNKMKTVINTYEQNETFPRFDFTKMFNRNVVHQ
nr:6K1 protein [Pennisetum mosaic virus]